MLVCPGLGLTFIHIPKTGGTSVEAALRTSDTKAILVESHGVLAEQPTYPAFAFVRNPWTRFASFWFGFFTVTRTRPMNETGVLLALAHPLMKAQTTWLAYVKRLGRYESLQTDFTDITGLAVELPVVGKSTKASLTPVAIKMVGEVYADEARLFGYTAWSSSSS